MADYATTVGHFATVNFTEDDDSDLLSYEEEEPAWNRSGSAKVTKMSPEVLHQLTILSFFMVIALIGNLTVLTHLIRIRGWQRPVTIFVMSLAVSDVLIAVFSMSVEILWEVFGEWIFGNLACKLATYVQCLLFVSTAFILMSISYDRYEAICKPMTFSRSLARSRKMIALSWVLAFIVALPQIFIFVQVTTEAHADGTPKYACKSQGYTAEWQRKIYVTWVAACVFLVPLVFVAFCYINIAIVVWRISSPYSCPGTHNGGECVVLRRNNSQKGVEQSKIKTVKLTICILTCYILCWTPYFTINLLNVWTNYRYKDNIPPFVKSLSKCLAWFSSCVNPIIYGGFHFSFRPLQKIFCPATLKSHDREQRGGSRNTSSVQPSIRTIRTQIDATSIKMKTFRKFKPMMEETEDVRPSDSGRITATSNHGNKDRPAEEDSNSLGAEHATVIAPDGDGVWL
ncbi:putative Vasopressin V1a receptor [Hypsibius exemplaris]|uniref:Vasopressin V1a receptor n=1 Tax=Hypsibius exemplaris TaxID=2072580 RepID=A0A1W0WUI6_HYPEX|nr:putative Vasopressin V1a receptor [Hypsibius exemplaris]